MMEDRGGRRRQAISYCYPPRLVWSVLKSKQRAHDPISAAENPDCVSLGTQNKERLNSLFHRT